MGPTPSALCFCVVLWLSSLCLGDSVYNHHTYSRISEVQRECASILSSPSLVKLDDSTAGYIPREMYLYGEWAPDSDDAPLMPLDMGPQGNASGLPRPLFRAYFSMVVDVDEEGWPETAINMTGALTLTIVKYENSGAQTTQRYSQIDIAFEGLYAETKDADGERVMCLLGSANQRKLKNVSDTRVDRFPALKDDKIFLVVHHPKSFNLTRREIKAEMTSLHKKSSPGYFGKVKIAFRSDGYSATTYKFDSGNITEKACSPYPHPDKWLGDHITVFKGPDFCSILHQLASGQVFTMLPNGRCDSTNDYFGKMWPFQSEDFSAAHGRFDSVRLVVTEIHCKSKGGPNGSNVSARVASLFKEVLPLENVYDAAGRTSLSRPIVSSEGIWNSSSGQLCMVACARADPSRCNLRICLYVSTYFSITQRSAVVGSISSISKSGELSNFSFSLGGAMPAYGLPSVLIESGLWYEYTKTNQAADFLRSDEAHSHGVGIKKALRKYPWMNEGGDLCGDLGLSVSPLRVQGSGSGSGGEYITLKILTLGSKFCAGFNQSFGNSADDPGQAASSPLTVSAELEITRNPPNKSLTLSVEGLYNQLTGKMYLVGCRVVPVPRKTASSVTEWQHLDCEIKVEIQYPPTTLRWLTMPTATVSIESNRSKEDPLYFDPVKLQTSAIMYRSQSEGILSERRVEVALQILTLSVVVACILSQLFYVKGAGAAGAPYVSHVMLGIQAIGYGLPLITGAETLFTRRSQKHYASSSYYYPLDDGSFGIAELVVKFLVLTAFLLTLRLWQRVWESRIRLARRVPSDKRVLVACLILHAVGFVVILLINPNTHLHGPIQTEMYTSFPGPSHGIKEWGARLEQYAGLVQDFFLLPQVIGNMAWQINCRPLRKAYYLGITLVRLLPHGYDYIRAPPMNVYFDQGYDFVDPDLGFYSKTGDVVIALVAGLLAAVVYFQQRCGCHGETKQMRWLGLCRLWSPALGGYDRVASVPSESELEAGAVETDGPAKAREDTH